MVFGCVWSFFAGFLKGMFDDGIEGFYCFVEVIDSQ